MKRIIFLIPALILLMLAGSTSIAQALEEGDGGYPGRFRVVHSAPGGPPVNVMVNGSVLHGPMWYGQTSPYISLSPAVYNIKVITADRHQTPVYNWDRWVNAGQSETIIITGDAEKNDYILLEDDASLPANPENGRIRFFNASPDAGLVDVVAIQDGSENVWFSFVGYKENQDYKEVASGIYNIEIRDAITNDVLLSVPI